MELEGRTIIITGASSGIGAAAARLFAADGAKLVLGARRAGELAQLVDDIADAGGAAVSLPGNVTDPHYAEALVALAKDTFGTLDGAFNNAAITGELAPASHMSEANWRSVIDTNLTSAFLAAKAQIPAMLAQGGGSIVFTGSFVGVSNGGMPGMGAYAASKAGLYGLVQSLACEHGADGIRINAILPGGTKTPMAGEDPQTHEIVAGLHPLKRMADPQEIAEAAMFLLSSRSSFVTGSAMAVDGGMAARLL